MRFIVLTAKSVRAAGLPRDPSEPRKAASAQAPAWDWEAFGRDIGRAVHKLRDGRRPGNELPSACAPSRGPAFRKEKGTPKLLPDVPRIVSLV
jgi:hypothetical protein